MADRQQQYRGKKAKLPELLEGELGFCTDTKELYIGSANGNVLIGSGAFAEAINNLNTELNSVKTDVSKKLTANQAESVNTLAADADVAAAVSCINNLINSLKTAGIMK